MKNKYLSLLLPSIGSAVIAITAQISLSFGVIPFTLQTLGVGLVATIYKTREALFSIFLYLLLGAIGLPVFAGGSGGISILVGPSSGFLWAYLLFALITSPLTNPKTHVIQIFLSNLVSDSLVFVCGATVFMLNTNSTLTETLNVSVFPFILIDLVKITVIAILSPIIFKSLNREPYFFQ